MMAVTVATPRRPNALGDALRYLRHAAISFWHALGVDPKTAAELAGHAQVAVTMNVYTHVAPETGRAAMLKLGDYLIDAGGMLGVTTDSSGGDDGAAEQDLASEDDEL